MYEYRTVINGVTKFIDEDLLQTESRLKVAQATSIVLKEGMRLLGIEALNKM